MSGKAASEGTAKPATVTLLTGDRVTVTRPGSQDVRVAPAKGREHLTFLTNRVGGDVYVIPQDAVTLVQSGKLDRQLFNVSALVRFGYDDAGRDTLPLIVEYQAGTARPAAVDAHGARVTRNLPAVNGAAVVATKDSTNALWPSLVSGAGTAHPDVAPGIARIWLDGQRKLLDDVSDQQIGAPAAWQAGYTGAGVTVAVLDGGIDTTHPDLAGKVVAEQNFSADPSPTDTFGHGTHVASIIAGTGAASGGQYKGVAPDAKLADGKVCESDFCDDSAILAGMQWAAADEHAKVVNISIGGGDLPGVDPLEQAVNDLTAQYGTLFVIAAGNDGADGTVESPGSADAALTVGAVDSKDQLADFSSRGPRVGDSALKPDITAPGVDIIAARAAGTELGEPVGDSYVKLSGTSMATPHVTGAVALLAQQHPEWSAAQFKAALMASAKPNPDLTAYEQGAGRVDVRRAIGQTVTSDPASVSLGLQRWPHNDDQPVNKTVTYHNAGTAEVTLNLALNVTGPDDTAPVAGMFTLDANQVTVPAGGQAQVTLTADTRGSGPDGRYSGELLATAAGGTQVSTPVGVDKEVESYNLTISFVDGKGAASTDNAAQLIGTDPANTGLLDFPYDPSGTVTLRLPKGHYDLESAIYTDNGGQYPDLAMVAEPGLNLTGDTHVTLDARITKPIDLTVPDPTATAYLCFVGYDHVTSTTSIGVGALGETFDGITTAQVGPSLPPTELRGAIASQFVKANADGSAAGTPYVYAVGEFPAGGLPTGFVKHYAKKDLATVRSEFAAVQPGDDANYLFEYAESPLGTGAWSAAIPVTLPSTLTRYLNKASWNNELDTGTTGPDGFPLTDAALTSAATYQPNRKYQERWNNGPFGPAFPTPSLPFDFVTRQGDELIVDPALFSDASGHSGGSAYDSGLITVYRNGVQLAQQPAPGGEFTLPADTAQYRVQTQATRSGFSGLSSTVTAAWTFRSGHVSGTGFAPLPVMAVRFTPKLDPSNRAPAGRFTIPVAVAHQLGSTSAKIRKLRVDVSYNDGQTWRPVALRESKNDWTATVNQPAGGFVSLRASATDSAGNTVEQTIIHAYSVK
ncbi:S8 family serine peptidase [Rugosimonospora acidiphila]|uniref:S8 family serine peptidase n=1 Tax=Rugosimonospora acidiphila TaxID=556531 RepID=A0ABP9RMM4_9ACTN